MLCAACIAALPAAAPGQAPNGTTISGRILDAQGGLPIPNAAIELDRGDEKVATTRTGADGAFAFANEPPGTYSFLIRAPGYQTSRAPDIVVEAGEAGVAFQTAINRAPAGVKTIAYVATAGRTALQTTTTISAHVDTDVLQAENYQRLGDALTSIPGVVTSTSSSVGDDMSLSIRGFDPTETATLLDGHPIGPVGAFGSGYNYNVSPFWGLSGADVIFGSGASGLFGATSIAGAVNFQTINPTRQTHLSVTQGVGSQDKLMTGFLGTGTVGKLGYALAWGSQGTTGNFPGGVITQRALLQTSVVHPGFPWPHGNASPPPPDLTSANVGNGLNTYWVTGAYSQKNFVGKLQYDASPKTQIQLTAYSATDLSDSTGEGDNDFQTYPYVLYGARQTLAAIESSPGGMNWIIAKGREVACHDSIAVLVDDPAGYTCMNPQQYALAFYGPFGGSVDRFRSLGNQDYDARVTQQLGAGTITLEGFADAYNYNAQKGPPIPLGQYTTYGPGPYYLNLYKNRGYLLSDDFATPKNDVAFGYSWLRQANTNGQFPYTFANGNQIDVFGTNPPLYLATASYFARDAWTPTYKLQVFGDIWVQRSIDTSSTHVDPRVSVIYRPDPSDVLRITGGHSYSEPDPSLLALAPPVYGSPSSINCPPATTGTGALTPVASVADPKLQPETAQDFELAYGHRFNTTTNVQADVYQSWESNALLNGLVPILGFPNITVPQDYIDKAVARLRSCAGLDPSAANLAFRTTYNAASARYRGVVLSINAGVARDVSLNAGFDVQSASYLGVPTDILIANTSLMDGGQIYGIPLRQGTAGISYQNASGFGARMDATYIGSYNSWNRGPFWFANASISKTSGPVIVGLGIRNLFNSAAQNYGLIGLGVYVPQNFFGSAAQGGPTSAIQQGTEEYGLPSRSYWLTVKIGM
jgi:outer membrane receptor protein involved in Fe transport